MCDILREIWREKENKEEKIKQQIIQMEQETEEKLL